MNELTPLWYPPRNAFWFDLFGDQIVNIGETTLISYQLPVGDVGVVRWFAQDITTPSEWDSITWKILVNSNPDKMYGNIIGKISNLDIPTDVMVKIYRGGLLKLVVSSTKNNIRVIGRLKGWHWNDGR